MEPVQWLLVLVRRQGPAMAAINCQRLVPVSRQGPTLTLIIVSQREVSWIPG